MKEENKNLPEVVTERSTDLSIDRVKVVGCQVDIIHKLVKEHMVEGTDFGVIPGTKNPTLLKPGAEKIGLLLNVACEFKTTISQFENQHREYRVDCTLTDRNSGRHVGSGVGSCSTYEKKYRYAKDRSGNQYERKDVADMWNTVLKMAKKRAYIDAIITTGAAGMVFTQDLEDMERDVNEKPHYEKKEGDIPFTTNPFEFRFAYGKHKGKLLGEVPRDYLEWCLTSEKGNPKVKEVIKAYLDNMPKSVEVNEEELEKMAAPKVSLENDDIPW